MHAHSHAPSPTVLTPLSNNTTAVTFAQGLAPTERALLGQLALAGLSSCICSIAELTAEVGGRSDIVTS